MTIPRRFNHTYLLAFMWVLALVLMSVANVMAFARSGGLPLSNVLWTAGLVVGSGWFAWRL